jgi:hypothetical protein
VAEANRCVSVTANDRERSKSSSNIISKLCKDLCKLCVTIAHNTIEELHKQIYTVYRTSPWHTLYYKDTKKINPRIVFPESRDLTNSGAVTFTATSVLMAATLCPSLEVKLDQNPCKALWDKALQIFAFYKAHVASAKRGIEALHKFRNYINSRGATNQG